ncbi:uncharacterized protein LOC134290104, partial [Aedes albopictus]
FRSKRSKGKSTNKDQFLRLVEELEEQPDIAKGFARFDTGPFWENLSKELNSLGPPIKTSGEWKKVWADWKSNLKRKLANNRKEQQATGGGPCKIIELSALEERVVDLAGLVAAVDGVDESISFGAPLEPDENMDPEAEDQVDGGVDEAADREGLREPARRKRRAPASLDLLESQVKQQKKFHHDVVDALQSQSKKMEDLAYYAKQVSKRMHEIQALQAEQLKEQRRHNLEMEKISLEKLKTKREILALQLDRL